jgi:NACalpha-BTF3-like transcription factor
MVAQQAGVSDEEALKALKESDGEPAEAIVKLIEKKGGA